MPKPKEKDPGFAEFIAEVRSDVGKIEDAETKAAWERVLGDEERARQIFRGGLREKDYYRRLNDINTEKESLAADRAKWEQWHAKANADYTKAVAERDAAVAELESQAVAFEKAGLDDDAARLRAKKDTLPAEAALAEMRRELDELKAGRAQLETGLNNVTAGAPALTAAFVKKARQLAKEGFEFDEEEVLKQIYKGTDPNLAFEDAVREQREKRAADDLEKKLAEARKAGREEALTATAAPDAFAPGFMSPFFASSGAKPADKLAEARQEAAKMAMGFGRPA